MSDFKRLSGAAFRSCTARVLAALSLVAVLGPAHAALTDVSDAPFFNSTSSQLKPNIMLLMDTSNSMRFSHMPDEIEVDGGQMPIGYKSHQCNVLYYNPNQVYGLPKASSGTPLPTPAFAAAPDNYYSVDSSTVNLGSHFRAYATSTRQYQTVSDTAQPAYYYLHSVAGPKNYLNPPCTDVDVGASVAAGDGGTWTRIVVSSSSGPGGVDERQNFANWYTYYRTRISLVKSAVSLAFTPLTDSYRVGLVTVRPDLATTANYLPIADFDATQRSNWYAKLFSQEPGGSSPSREGLARVGRHYAGRQDSINAGMSGDPIQFSCQQNFTIMTTDGYWNVAAETAGPVKIDGVTLVGQQDGTLTDDAGWTPRPIWDGGADTSRLVTDKTTQYQSVVCVSPYANRSTAQNLQSTSQNLQSTAQTLESTLQLTQSTLQNFKSTAQTTKSTSQLTQSTLQNLQSTLQNLKSTAQTTKSTSQTTKSTLQNLQSTLQNFKSTAQITQTTSRLTQSTSQLTQSTLQNLQSTSQLTKSTSQLTKSTSQITKSTLQNLKSTSQLTKSTSQLTRRTSQLTQSTLQNLKSTSQITRSTTQLTKSTSQLTQSTLQNLQSTSRVMQSTTQVFASTSRAFQSTSQILKYDAATELTTPVASCTPGGNIYCSTSVTGPTPVASCTPVAAAAGNLYTATTCASSTTGPTAVASCTPVAATAGNGYTATTCDTVTTGPTAVATCTPATAGSGNSYTATTCATVTTGPTAVATCTPAAAGSGNGYTATTCSTATSGPTGVASCTPVAAGSGNAYTATTCATATSGPTGVASCTPATASSGNSYTATTCDTITSGPTAVASCTAATASSGNSYTATTCNTITTGPTAVATCSPATAASGNQYTATTCSTATTGPTGVASCSPVTASSGNSYTATTCNTVTTGPTGVASCSPVTAAAGNNYTATTCSTVTTGPTGVSSCTAATASSSNSYKATTCNTVTTGPTAIATCTPAGASSSNSYTATTCSTATTGPTAVATCTPVSAASGNQYTATTCNTVTSGPTGVASCTAAGASSSNSYTATTCNTVTSGPTGVASCTAAGASSSNGYTATTCNTVTSGPTPVATCTAAGASSSNSYTATTCSTVTTGPTGVGSCTPIAASVGNNWVATTCNTVTTGPTGVASCTPVVASAGNDWVAITCATVVTGPVGVASCTPELPSAANGYATITCGSVTTGPTAVASCTPVSASSGNSYTATTCSSATTGPTAVASCTPVSASSGNSYTATTCSTATSGPTGVASCTPVSASSGNQYTATTCDTATTGPTGVASCTPAAAAAGNSYTATTCDSVVSGPTAVATCTPVSASSGNSYTATTCSTATSGPTAVASCTPATAVAGNGYTATTCSTAATGPTGVASCTPATAAAGNSYTATTCNTVTSGPTGVSACTPAIAAAGNSYTATTCDLVVSGPTAVATCTPVSAAAGNSYTATTCDPVTTGPTAVATCTPVSAAAGNSYTTITCDRVTSGPTGVASCTPVAAAAGNAYTATSCTTATTGPTAVATCTPESASAGNSHKATTCTTATTGPLGVESCTAVAAAAGNAYTATTCDTLVSGPDEVASCTPVTAAAPEWQSTFCDFLPGHKLQTRIQTAMTTILRSGGFETSRSTTTDDLPFSDVDGVCHPDASTLVAPLGPLPADARSTITEAPPPIGCSDWPCSVDSTIASGSNNSLADVAQYYYVTDLRPDMLNDVRVKNTSGAEEDRATHQHMTTFTLALGVSGTLTYSKTYKLDTVGDFSRIRCNPLNGGCNNTCSALDPSFPNCTSKYWPVWPDPAVDYVAAAALYSNPKSIDDFWHTAVNGRGLYFSANDPNSVVAGLQEALAGIQSLLGAGSAAATSTMEPVAGDRLAYRASYRSMEWVGDLAAYEIDLATGLFSDTGDIPLWRSQPLLDARVGTACDKRTIYLFRSGASNNLVDFTWQTRTCDASNQATGDAMTGLNADEQAHFDATRVAQLSQYPAMSDGSSGTVDQRSAAAGANLVNYLRGHHTLEGPSLFKSNDLLTLYRTRTHVLGDIVSSQPAFIKGPFASYADAGHSAFKAAQAARTPMIYTGANDGMLHAFEAASGEEVWAFIPKLVLPNLFKLADNNYANTHQFYVDGSPAVSDVYDVLASPAAWKTILVGGLNKGGKGYYALDVTDPATPKALWEFGWSDACWDGETAGVGADCHVGYTFGRPIISKLQDGTWVALLTSGLNNVNVPAKAGDGQGYLYVLNAVTGKLIAKISTGAGDAGTPSGLNQINNFVDNSLLNNTSLRVYGVDLLGNVWRFDINDNLAPDGLEATLLGTAKDSAEHPQPLTTRPELGEIDGYPWLFVGSGRLLGLSDLPDTQTQSIYGFKDPLTGSPAYADANLRAALNPLQMTKVVTEQSTYRTLACIGDCASSNGWVVDLPDSGERVNTDLKLQLGTLTFASNVPSNSACSIGGYSWLNFMDFRTGLAVLTSPDLAVSRRLNDTLAVGTNILRLSDGRVVVVVIGSGDKPPEVVELPVLTPAPAGKRVSWREVID
ncbi:MAG: PilC/PilY family type IV pilus protein [Candidatus Accumulibacter sp. UW26]|jgi:Tfp pilus tip-associated adhesin PilY1